MVIFNILYSLFISFVIVGGGYLCKMIANNSTNDLVGYRTKRSKKNQETWKEGNTYAGRILTISGILYLILSLIFGTIVFPKSIALVIFTSVAIIPVLLIDIFIIERHLKNIFDNDGNRKETL